MTQTTGPQSLKYLFCKEKINLTLSLFANTRLICIGRIIFRIIYVIDTITFIQLSYYFKLCNINSLIHSESH